MSMTQHFLKTATHTHIFTFSLFFFFTPFSSFLIKKMLPLSPQLYDKIKYFAKFPQTGVSLRQMVMFGMRTLTTF